MTPGEQACNDLRVSLKEYFESRLRGLEDQIQNSGKDLERRLEGLNELRQQVVSDRGMFTTRELHDRLQADVSELESKLTSLNTKIATWYTIVAGAYGIIQIVLSVVFYHLFNQPK